MMTCGFITRAPVYLLYRRDCFFCEVILQICLELLGVTRPTVRRNCEVAAFRKDVRLWDQPPRARRTMLCQFFDGEFVLEVVDIDVDQTKLIVWSTHARPVVVYWIRCVVEAMMPGNSRIHTGWQIMTERRLPIVGVTSALSVVIITLYRHLMGVPEIPAPDITTARQVMLNIFGHLAELFA